MVESLGAIKPIEKSSFFYLYQDRYWIKDIMKYTKQMNPNIILYLNKSSALAVKLEVRLLFIKFQ
jgi:hypothetical protein